MSGKDKVNYFSAWHVLNVLRCGWINRQHTPTMIRHNAMTLLFLFDNRIIRRILVVCLLMLGGAVWIGNATLSAPRTFRCCSSNGGDWALSPSSLSSLVVATTTSRRCCCSCHTSCFLPVLQQLRGGGAALQKQQSHTNSRVATTRAEK